MSEFKAIFFFILFLSITLFSESNDMKRGNAVSSVSAKDNVPLADPFILLYEGRYYAYGTHASDGIEVYVSEDLKR